MTQSSIPTDITTKEDKYMKNKHELKFKAPSPKKQISNLGLNNKIEYRKSDSNSFDGKKLNHNRAS